MYCECKESLFMGGCWSCRRAKAARFKDKGTKICNQISCAVSPLHTYDEPSLGQVNGGLPIIGPDQDTVYMANTISNIKITNPIKGLVSKRRKRYKEGGFNLDLTYINDNVIAMGYPAEKLEGVYRNHIDDVVKFLEQKHKNHYWIYNLCSERSYDCAKFQSRVAIYPFDDHNPPKMEVIQPFCADVHKWLTADPKNVAAVHCKAGKGRTGTMVCCYMLHSGQFENGDDALNFYGQTRTHDRKGVTIPSQRRYVNYYAQLKKERLLYTNVTLYIDEIKIEPLPGSQGFMQFSIAQGSQKLYSSMGYEMKKGPPNLTIRMDQCIPLTGDVKLEFFSKNKMIRKEKLFQFWFNTFFVRDEVMATVDANGRAAAANDDDPHPNPQQQQQPATTNAATRPRTSVTSLAAAAVADPNSNVKTFILTLNKLELDVVHKKDKQNKIFSSDFKVSLLLHPVPSSNSSGTPGWLGGSSRPTTVPQDTPSESSEAESSDDDEEDGWESVEILEHPQTVGYRLLSEPDLAPKAGPPIESAEILTA